MHVLDLFNDKERRFLNGGPLDETTKQRLDPSCWSNKKIGNPKTKIKGGVRVNNCVPKESVEEGQLDNPGEPDSPVAQAIVYRIKTQRTDLLAKYGLDKVSAAVDEVADFVGDVDEIGSSDVSGWIRHVEQMLGNMEQGVAEAKTQKKQVVGFTSSDKFKTWEQYAQKEGYEIREAGNLPGSYAAFDDNGKRVGYFYNEFDLPNGYYYLGEILITPKKQGVAEGVAETLPLDDALKVLRHYGATNLKTTSNELHFYKNGRPFSVDLIWNNDATRSVSLSQLNSAGRKLKGQGIDEATGDKPFDDMMKTIKKGTAKQATADRREQRKQSQQQARDAFGPNPAANLGIRKPPVSEGTYSTDRLISKRQRLQQQLTIANDSTVRQRLKDQIIAINAELEDIVSDNNDLTRNELEFFARATHDPKTGLAIDRTVPGRTTAKLSNRSPRAYTSSNAGLTKISPNTGRNITQPGQTGRTQPKFDSDGSITEQNMPEGDTEQKPRIRKYTKMRPDGSKAIRYEVLDYMGRRANGQGSEGFDDLKNAKQFYYRNRVNLVEPVDESTVDIADNDTQIEPIGMKESSRYWCKEEKRWKDDK